MKYLKVIMILFVCLVGLKGCRFNDNKASLKEGTNVNATLYNLEEQRHALAAYPAFYQASNLDKRSGKEFGTYIIPGLIETESLMLHKNKQLSQSKSMDPQGVTVTEDYLLISAYSHDEEHNSVIYVLDRQTHSYLKTVVLQGKPHVGGLTYDHQTKNIWVCDITPEGKAAIASISLQTLENYHLKPNKQPVKYDQFVVLDDIDRASFITYHDQKMYVGYFSEVAEGVLGEYHIDEHGQLIKGLKNQTRLTLENKGLKPSELAKIVHGIQGITFYRDYLLLSQSYGPENSKILIYPDTKKSTRYLDKEVIKTIEAPPYLEQITAHDGQLYTIFESGTQRFRDDPVITKVDRVIMLNLNKLLTD